MAVLVVAGVGKRDHLLPFHSSARATCAPVVPTLFPTATQLVGDWQATPRRVLDEPAGSTVCWTCQAVPSHRSASILAPPPAGKYEPTAVHVAGAGQDTRDKEGACAPTGAGVGCTDHAVPSQRSARGREPLPPSPAPTAVQAVALVQATPARLLNVPGLGI